MTDAGTVSISNTDKGVMYAVSAAGGPILNEVMKVARSL